MTLVVAGIDAGQGWLVADGAASGGPIGLRDRPFVVKVYPIGHRGLFAFAGDIASGIDIADRLFSLHDDQDLLAATVAQVREHPSVEALLFVNHSGPRLYKISSGRTERVTATYIGEHEAFNAFQEIRHSSLIDHPPEAMQTLVVGSYRDVSDITPDACTVAIRSMYSLFASYGKVSVGGWALPYVFDSHGATIIPYFWRLCTLQTHGD